MKRSLVSIAFALASESMAEDANELAIEQHPFRVYSAFWPNLHYLLWAQAWAKRPSAPSTLSLAGSLPEPLVAEVTQSERAAWDAAVAYYDREVADLGFFEMGPIRKALVAATDELRWKGLAPAHRRALAAAAPVYRKHWWPTHDRANREWIREAMPKVASLSPGVPERLASLYGTPWFTRSVRVDVVRVASRQGAFTSKDPAPAHITISSSKPALAGWASAETLFHESSHALVQPLIAAFAAELRARRKKANDLWHVALFYMTGEIVREALAARGITYEPYLYATGLFDRAWPQFKSPLETHWKAYVDGQISREMAIKEIVAAIK